MIGEYIYARGRLSSYYTLPLDSIRDVSVSAPADVAQLKRYHLKKLEVDETINAFRQTYCPTAWIRRRKRWVPFEFVNLALWEAVSWDTSALKVVAKGLLIGIAELIDGTPLEETLVVRRVEISEYAGGSQLGVFPSPGEVRINDRVAQRFQRTHCVVM